MGRDVEKAEAGSVDLRGDHPNENGDSEERSESDGLKSCTDCRTTKTPLWRGGPSGPKSLCNACGIRWRKKRREILGLKDGAAADKDYKSNKSKDKKKKSGNNSSSIMSVMRIDVLVKQKKRSSLLRLKRRGIGGEEEEAAFLLMALSSGLLYA